ncbi:MAG: hypothetical protein ABIA59_11195 [Candidatus Latescibacterota bacterium]
MTKMTMMTKRTIQHALAVIVILSAIGLYASAEKACATSVFSMNLLGERLEGGDTRSIALGGAYQMVHDSLGVLQLNPALLTYCRKVTVGASQFIAMDKGRSDLYTERDVSVSYPVFMAAFPLTKFFTFGIGFRGQHDPDGTFSSIETLDRGTSSKRTFSKKGGLYSIPFSFALTVSRYAAVGLYYSLENGSIEERWDVTFNDPKFAPGVGSKKENLSGSGYGAGVLLFPDGPVMLGATFEGEIEYDAAIKERFTLTALDTSYSGTVKVPPRFSVALTWSVVPSWNVLASYATSDFTQFVGLNFAPDRLYREESFAFGAEYSKGVPIKGLRFPLRFSFNYQRLPYDFPAGERIRKILFGLGTGLNIGGGKAKMDVALQAGKVGSLSNNTLEDRLVRFYVSVVGSEVWKRKGEGGFR